MKLFYKVGVFSSLFLLLLTVLFSGGEGFAQTATVTPTPDNSGKLNELRGKIDELKRKVDDLQSQEKTLNSQISVMDNQVKLPHNS